jgi:transcription elongation factor GreB
MSRAFVKENDLEHAGIDIPERPVSKSPNYVTNCGLEQLLSKAKDLEQDIENLVNPKNNPEENHLKMKFERDLRYYSSRIQSAILIDTKKQSGEKILFGAHLELKDENHKSYLFQIVGEDEADIKKNKLSYQSPLAQTLIGGLLGEEVLWQRADGDLIVVIEKVEYK